jgi:hypothetical protein
MKVSEFIEWLKTQDQEAIVSCLVHHGNGSYYEQGGTCEEQEFIPEHSDYTDFRGNQFVKPGDHRFNKRYLIIGGRE